MFELETPVERKTRQSKINKQKFDITELENCIFLFVCGNLSFIYIFYIFQVVRNANQRNLTYFFHFLRESR